MTFIIAIQLNDSIIIAADTKKVVLDEYGALQFSPEKVSKLHLWNKGIITGTGELNVITQTVELFKNITHSDLNKIPECLNISRQLRELEIGQDNFQVQTTKLLFSNCCTDDTQLYKVELFEKSQPYIMTAIEPMDITLWLFDPNIEAISTDLQSLYQDLKDYSCFANKVDWINYYINRIAPIYKKQSKHDFFMSQSFDIFFQTKNDYILSHIDNTHITALEFSEITADCSST